MFFDDLPASIVYAQSLQINAQVPWELADRTSAQVHIEYNGTSTRMGIVRLQPSASVLFPARYGAPQGAIINQDRARNSAANPAPAGSVVSIYGAGGGPANPDSLTRGLAPHKPPVVLKLLSSITIDDSTSADITYAGVAPTLISGLFQINFRVSENLPASATHKVELKIGTASTAGLISVTIATKW